MNICEGKTIDAEYINKADVLDIIDSMPQDLVYEHIYELKGMHVDVVHCRDCIHFDKTEINHNGLHFCQWMGLSRLDDWFCADGKRRIE